jgi:cadmium resistance protein CadD (predicted permease)
VNLGTIGQAIGTFAVTNIDDLVVLAVFFGQTAGHRGATLRVIGGQYVGFIAILATSFAFAFVGTALLPKTALPYLGLLPIALGLWAAWRAWRERRSPLVEEPLELEVVAASREAPRLWRVAAVTIANSGDNIGVYAPIFAVATLGAISVFTVVFLIGVAIWCAAGKYFASHPIIARALSRWGHIVLPIALIGIGLAILIEGGAFGM